MGALSIGKAWEEAAAFVRREGTLLFPVALLFVALPTVILQEMTPPELTAWMAAPKADTMPAMPPSYSAALLLTLVLIWFGSLALFALALRPGISVGEALRLSLARLPVQLGTAFLAGAAMLLAIILLSVPLMFVGGPAGPILVMVGVGAFAGTRLLLLNPVVIDDRLGVVASLRRAWALSRGHFWRLFGFIILLTLLSGLVASAAQVVLGLIAGLIGGAEAARFVGGLAAAIVSTVVQVYALVMLARLYRQATG